jgi:transitional endoplasmic reticulum ATPase
MPRPRLQCVPLCDLQKFHDVLFESDSLPLRELLERAPAVLLDDKIEESWLDQPLRNFHIQPISAHLPLGLRFEAGRGAAPQGGEVKESTETKVRRSPSTHSAETPAGTDIESGGRPVILTPDVATRLCYAREIDTSASFLRAGLSVLILCEKLVVRYLWKEICQRANRRAVILEASEESGEGLVPRSLRQRQIMKLKELVPALHDRDALVISHLDLLAGGDGGLATEARELIELLYGDGSREQTPTEPTLLAFSDPSLDLPEVLASRFAVRLRVSGTPRLVTYPDGTEKLAGDALVTCEEAALFQGFDSEGLYKNVAGLNPVRLRNALVYAHAEHGSKGSVPVAELYRAIRAFKAQTSASFEVPDVHFSDIGGYDEVKAEIAQALRIMNGSFNLPEERLRSELLPRGFIFHGPPGTGKTLFAKAIANELNATIQIVSGPEVTDMYVGESERKVRELFAEARRNAPAVIVFDEFDSIAGQRSGRDDGGSRAGNAIVAQILTEMDGFRPDVPMLVIGTTNRLDIIDEALLRPSRFQAIAVELPNTTARREIARVHARHFHVELGSELLGAIAEATRGMNGDEIRSIFRDACVGEHCEDPPLRADARRLGALVGKVRRTAQERAASRQRQACRAHGRRGAAGGPPAPGPGMVRISGPSPASASSSTPESGADNSGVITENQEQTR